MHEGEVGHDIGKLIHFLVYLKQSLRTYVYIMDRFVSHGRHEVLARD